MTTGTYQLTVSFDGVHAITSPLSFTIFPKPLDVLAVSPSVGPAAGGTAVSVQVGLDVRKIRNAQLASSFA